MKRHNHTIAEYNEAMQLLNTEPTIRSVEKITGINYNTLRSWKTGRGGPYEAYYLNKVLQAAPPQIESTTPIEYLTSLNPSLSTEVRNAYYSFIFGLYLGDGCISKTKSKSLNIYLDKKYGKMNKYISFCYGELFGREANICDRSTHKNKCNCVVVKYSNPFLGLIFPQEGVGRKHFRKIEIHEWQKQILNPVELIKGLMFSDGSFYYDKFNKKYFYTFTNCSLDIIEIMMNTFDEIGIKYTYHTKKKFGKTSYINGKEVESKTLSTQITLYSIDAVKKLHDLIGDKNNPIVSYGLDEITEKVKEYDYKTIASLELNLKEYKHDTHKEIKTLQTCSCGNEKSKESTACIKCSTVSNGSKRRKFEISKEELETLIKEKPLTDIGEIFGISDNGIRKRCKTLGIELKPMRGYWTKQKAIEKTK